MDDVEPFVARTTPHAVVASGTLRNGARSEMCEAPKGPAERDRDRPSQFGEAPLALSPLHPFVGETGIFVFPPAEMRERLHENRAGNRRRPEKMTMTATQPLAIFPQRCQAKRR